MESGMKSVQQADPSRQREIQKNRLRENCREFESVMVGYMMKTMRDGVIRAEDPDSAGAMYEEMLDGQISKTLSNTTALGIGDILYAKLEPLINAQPSKSEGLSGPVAPADPAQPDNSVTETPSSAAGSGKLF
jgi:Rod binding domain-containing protein